jgi:hypothetical protein
MKRILVLLVIGIGLFAFKPAKNTSASIVKTSAVTAVYANCISDSETTYGLQGTVYISHDCSRNGQPYQMGSAAPSSISVNKTINGIKYGGTLPLKSVTYGPLTEKCEYGALEVYTPWTAVYSGKICKL